MGLKHQSNTVSIFVLLTVTSFSCSFPFFGGATTGDESSPSSRNPASLSGLVALSGDCTPGYYQIKLKGIFNGTQVQVDAQTDPAGRFILKAPPGQYLLMAHKGVCTTKQVIELEENTEHMISVTVNHTNSMDQVERLKAGRLPASVLIESEEE